MKRIVFAVLFAVGFASCSAKSFQNIEVAEFSELISDSNVQLVDVRTPAEFAVEHLENALLIDFRSADFDSVCAETLDPLRPVALYCRSGKRSAAAAQRLADKGFTTYNLVGGILKWNELQTKISRESE